MRKQNKHVEKMPMWEFARVVPRIKVYLENERYSKKRQTTLWLKMMVEKRSLGYEKILEVLELATLKDLKKRRLDAKIQKN